MRWLARLAWGLVAIAVLAGFGTLVVVVLAGFLLWLKAAPAATLVVLFLFLTVAAFFGSE